MSKLEELIQQYCPDGVEYKTLGCICKTLNKGTLTTKELVESDGNNYPVINSGRALYGYYPHYNNEGDAFTVASRGEYAGFITYFENKFWAGGLCYPYRSNTPTISTKFIYYFLKSKQEYIRYSLVAEGSIPALNKGTLELLEIPVPPLPVQEEIVRILDTFTELQAELQAELQKRLQQYNYYRDNLLSSGGRDDVEWKKLGDVAIKIASGKNKDKSNVGDFPVFGSTGVIARTNTPIFHKSMILVARVGANAGFVHLADGDYDITDNTLYIDLDNSINIRYLYYQLMSMNINQYAKGGGQPLITGGLLKDLEIPIPSLAEQQRIVDILDRFDSLTNDLTQGLPAEIEKRKQQYEYYRDKLLTFKRAN